MTTPVDTTIFVFAKPPRRGASKTRLAASLGDEAAVLLAAAFFGDVWAAARTLPGARVVLAATDSDPEAYGLPRDTPLVSQGDGDLGERMERVLASGLAKTPYAILVGSDCPGVSLRSFAHGRAALGHHDACLAPTRDGGFYSIAMRRIEARVFEGIPWSTRDAYAATRARLEARGFRTGEGWPWFDVDHAGDLDHLRASWDAVCADAPRTADAMTRLGLAPTREARVPR